MNKSKLSKQYRDELINRFISGQRLRDIVKETGISHSTLHRTLNTELGKEKYQEYSKLMPVDRGIKKSLGPDKSYKNCQYCGKAYDFACGRKTHEKSCEGNPDVIPKSPKVKSLRRHSQETKDKLSLIRKAYILANPDKVPYRLYHKSKGRSYPEKYFREVFEQRKLGFEEQYSVGSYDLDFAFTKNKVGVEIDGNQHFVRGVRVNSDFIRDERLLSQDWVTFRIVWADFQRLDLDLQVLYIDEIVAKLGL